MNNQNFQLTPTNHPYLYFDDDLIKSMHEWSNNAYSSIQADNEVFDGEHAFELNIPVKGFSKDQLFLAIDEETMFLIINEQGNFPFGFTSYAQVRSENPDIYTKSYHVSADLINASEISDYYIHELETLKVILPKLEKDEPINKVTSIIPIY